MEHINQRRNDLSPSDCVAAFPNELPVDAVGLWQVVNTFRRTFGLEEPDLGIYVRKSIHALLAAGAVPVVGSARDKAWHIARGFDQQGEEKTEAVVQYLRGLGKDPDVGDLWLALPKFVKGAE